MELATKLLEAMAAYCADVPLDWTEEYTDEEWLALFRLSAQQNIAPMVYEAIRGCPAYARVSPALQGQMRNEVVRKVIAQTLRTEEFRKIYRAFAAEGIHPLVVKGIVCRSLYRQPDYRPSGDEDILIRPEWLPVCQRILADFGLQQQKADDEFEVSFSKPGTGFLLEIHKSLFAPDSDAMGDYNAFFESAMESAMTVTIDGTEIRTLNGHDHLLYLILHAIKHFIHSGFGIRQVLDIGLWAQWYGDQVDWPLLRQQCEQAHAAGFAAGVFDAAERCFGIPAPSAPCWKEIAADSTAMLEDLLSGGIYGATDQSRLHSGTVTLNAVAAQRKGKRSGSLLRTVFPSGESLRRQYPYLEKHPALLPVAWTQRLWKYGKETKNRDSSTAESLKTANRRLELLKQYGILE